MITGFGYNVNAQKNTEERKQLFEKEMNAYITTHLNEEIAEIKQNTDLIENFDEYTEEDIRSMAKENAKDKYIRHNMKEYLNTYFSNPQAMVTTDTFVCDNGGVEDDFLYYKGYVATYTHGSSSCTPIAYNGSHATFTPAALPTPRRFEIVTSGIDPLINIQKVKFGNKALKINDKYGHINQCNGDRGVDKITKRFKVTEENRDFTIWYAVGLENPADHTNQQPFLNIKCDLAPDNELCFDADFLPCDEHYSDNICPGKYSKADVLDWTCHRFKIPKNEIGNIATLEIVVADCGKGAHAGFAYIDGICEECDSSSALGNIYLDPNIDYFSCFGDSAIVCGNYSFPSICGQWTDFNINIPGFNITNMEIDSSSMTFCFNVPKSNFTQLDCRDLYAEIDFYYDSLTMPTQYSNSIEICKSKYSIYYSNIVVGDCEDNNTNLNISDDYYYVYLDVYSYNEDWIIERELVDPYPNEPTTKIIATGTGDSSLILGPFLIQEGDWWLISSVNWCFGGEEFIQAPDYCSGCDKFYKTEIGNVQCDQYNPTTYWKFDIYVPGDPSKQYYLDGPGGGPKSYNVHYTITGLKQDSYCKEYTLVDAINQSCTSKFTICPPKPCDDDCDLQVEADVECYTDEDGNDYFYVNLDVSGAGQGQHYCYSTMEAPYANNPSPNTISGTPLIYNPITGSYTIGFFTADIYLTVYLCDNGVDCSQNCKDCFKTLYIPNPDCERQKEIESGGKGKKLVFHNNNWISNKTHEELGKLIIVPNPFTDNTIVFKSNMETNEFKIYNSSGQLIKAGNFKGNEYKMNLEIPKGLYFVRYKNNIDKPAFVKMIKL